MLRIKAMNSGELDREDFGFSVAVSSLSKPLAALPGREGSETVNGNLFFIQP